jgi:hypothetical protein
MDGKGGIHYTVYKEKYVDRVPDPAPSGQTDTDPFRVVFPLF